MSGRIRTPVGGVHHLVARNEEVLGALPVADADRAAAAGLPPWRAAEHLASRALLRFLLREVGEDAGGGPVAALPGGRPYLPGRPGLGVSLSHSSGWVAAAVGRGRGVGVDVQVPAVVGDRLLRLCCRPGDADVLAALPEEARRREFARVFAVQEACVKAVGEGFAGRPWTVPVPLGGRTGAWNRVRWAVPRDDGDAVPVACAWTVPPVPVPVRIRRPAGP
ncbi:4'-phosphopantetheinyl transferase family protein [Streptomyces bikiniensis]|uniref:4'-phosphopantetheinyl transferase family protein n=1 Tax=Streptomyces bikiniensis TaxID=1896 RepID=UPI001F466B72|nr:4'-phosphopantetheinyl transferase superfamily protein [Streptomyces bikiniensis]